MTDFDEFWATYPRKVNRADAEINYGLALKGQLPRQRKLGRDPVTHKTIIESVEWYRLNKPDWCDWLHGATYLSKLRWEDKPDDVVERQQPADPHLQWKQREHESGQAMHPSLAEKYGWAEFGSVKLRVVG